ncbi:hypothetical protein BN903_1 [Halorubrum sp. AJ67]|nr:hypothetical protein BN903_1 [Halorubrum sp. AJ67]
MCPRLGVPFPLSEPDRISVLDDARSAGPRREPPLVHVRQHDDRILQPLRRVNRLDGHRVVARVRAEVDRTPGLDAALDEPDQLAAGDGRRVVRRLDRVEEEVRGVAREAVAVEDAARDRADRLQLAERVAERGRVVRVRLRLQRVVDLVERVAGPFEDDRPAAVGVRLEDPEPREQQLRRVGPEQLDPAVVRHREVVLVGDVEELPAVVSGPREHRDIAVLRRARLAVLALDGVVVVADDVLDLREDGLVFVLVGDSLDDRVVEGRVRGEFDDVVEGGVDLLAARCRRLDGSLGEVDHRRRRPVVLPEFDPGRVGGVEGDPLGVVVEVGGEPLQPRLEVEDVADVRVLERVDALLPVADGTEVLRAGQKEGELELDLAGVLELVDHDVLELRRLPGPRVLAQEHEREQLEEAEREVVPPQGEPDVLDVDVVDERLELLAVLEEGVPRNVVVEPLRPAPASEFRLRGRVAEVRLVPPEAAQVLTERRLLPPVVSRLIRGVEQLLERREVAVEVRLAVAVPAVGRGDDPLRGELPDQIEQLARLIEDPIERGVLRVVVAEAAEELPEPLGLDQLVVHHPRRAGDPLVEAEVRRGGVAVFPEYLVTVRVERPDRRVGQLPQPVLAAVDDPLFHLRRGAPRERREQDVVGLDVVTVDDVPVATGDGERLPGPRAGVDEVGPLGVLDQLPLRVVGRRVAHRSPSNSRSRLSTRR